MDYSVVLPKNNGMKLLSLTLLMTLLSVNSIYDFKINSLEGDLIDFSKIQRQESPDRERGFQMWLHTTVW